MIKIESFGGCSANPLCCSYLIYDNESNEGYLVDPGNYCFSSDITPFIEKNFNLKGIILTHCHFDHMLYAKKVSKAYNNAPIMAHKKEAILGLSFPLQIKFFLKEKPIDVINKPLIIDKYLSDGEILNLGEHKIIIHHAPGHSPGSIILEIPELKSYITGDVIFKNSFGRSDFPFSNSNDLLNTINNIIMNIPNGSTIYTGHICYGMDNIFVIDDWKNFWHNYNSTIN